MGFFDSLFKSDSDLPTKNSEIINAHKILQNSSLSYEERVSSLTKLRTIFLTSNDKNDLKAIATSILKTVATDGTLKVRDSALNTLDAIIASCFSSFNDSPTQVNSRKLSVVSQDVVPQLILITRNKSESAKELRQVAFWTLSKVAFFAIDDERIRFFARSLTDNSDQVRMAVMNTFENLVRLSDDELKRRISRFSLSALCSALNDSTLCVRAAKVMGGLGKFALSAAPFLYKHLDDEDGEWAASALRDVSGVQFRKDEKKKWEEWLQKYVITEEGV
jgi:hypothetical protein